VEEERKRDKAIGQGSFNNMSNIKNQDQLDAQSLLKTLIVVLH
jgi:hypothetical protein